MENETEIVWHKFKSSHVAMKGEQIVGIVEPAEDFPCEAFVITPVSFMYLTVDAAKEEFLKGHERFLKRHAEDEKPEPNFYLEVLKQVVAALEAKAQKP